jgi:hypothetical protein
MNTPTFEEFSGFLRDFTGTSSETAIDPVTRLEADLGVTGDDGDDLLKETEEKYGVSLSTPDEGYRPAFGLSDHEYLFHSEGFDLLGFFRAKEKVVEITVGQLYDAVVKLKSNQALQSTSLRSAADR